MTSVSAEDRGEDRGARAREAATREVLAVISRSRDDVGPVFDTILVHAARLCGADAALLNVVSEDGEWIRTAAHLGLSAEGLDPTGVQFPVDGVGVASRCVQDRTPRQEGDLKDSDLYRSGYEGRTLLVDDLGMRALLAVPLLSGERAIGCIDLMRTAPGAFPDDDVALVETFAEQAVIAIDNARQFRELQTRLEREAATKNILRVISSSRDDEAPVFDAILESAARLCSAESAALMLVNDERTHNVVKRRFGRQLIQIVSAQSWALDSGQAHAEAARTGAIVHIADLADTDLYRSGDETRVQLVDEAGVRTALAVPIFRDDEAIGVIVLHRMDEPRPFSENDILLVEAFAAQAVIAIENVRQFRALEDSNADLTGALERQTATAEVLDVISQSPSDVQPVFDVIAATSLRLCDADRVVIWRIEAGAFALAATLPDTAERRRMLGENPPTMDEASVAGRAFAARESVQAEDLQADPLLSQSPIARMTGTRTLLVAPLFSPTGEPVAMITMARREVRPFDPEDIALIETFADQAAIAIENVRLFHELQTRLEREAASREILDVISRSRADEGPVFDVILKNACRLCDAQSAFMTVVDETGDYIVSPAQYGASPEFLASFGDFRVSLATSPLGAAVTVRERRVLRVDDCADSDLYLSGDPHRVNMVDIEGIRSILTVPLLTRDAGLGAIILYRTEVMPFSDEQVALVEAFAAQAVIAIENVRQFRAIQAANDELQSRLEREAATGTVLHVISQSRADETPVFDAILEAASRLCHAPLAFMSQVDEAGAHLSIPAHRGARPEMRKTFEQERHAIADSQIVSAHCVREKSIFRIDDMVSDTRFGPNDANRARLIDVEGVRSYLVVPMLSGETCLGTINLYRREVDPFSDEDVALVEAFAAQAVIAIENVRQFREVQTRLEHEAATQEILSVISRSRDDAAPVFETLLATAQRLCQASNAALVLGDEVGGLQTLVAQTGASEETLARYRDGFFTMDPDVSIAARAILEGRTLYYPVVAEGAPYLEGMEAARVHVEEEGIQTSLYVPLLLNGRGVGCINLLNEEQRTYSQNEIALIETFAAQAVIAIENVRQFREVRTRLERETATREILSVISRSRDDEAPVFDIILKNASRLCDAPMAVLGLISEDGQHYEIAAHIGTRPEFVDYFRQNPPELDPERYVAARAMVEKRTINVDDLADPALYGATDSVRLKSVQVEGTRSAFYVPLILGDRSIGAIFLYRRVVSPFTDDDIALVEAFAAQAVIAIENVRQFRELQTRLEREAATGEVLSVISRSRDDDQPVFDTILDQACRLCDVPFAFLCLVEETTSVIRAVATCGSRPAFEAYAKDMREPLDSPLLIAAAIREARAINIADLRAETRSAATEHPVRRLSVDKEGIRSILYVPLLAEGAGIGCIGIYRREVRPFLDDEVKLIETFAAQAVIAIENVRQFKALETLNAELGDRVEEQVGEIERMGRLKRFLPSAVADAVVSQGSEKMLSSHRALLGVLFCDIRGFTAFCETAEPEETIEVLQTYHEEMGKLIAAHGAGVDHRMGDGVMVLFNDPLPCDDPAGEALRLADSMRERMAELCAKWKRLGHRLGFGVGISLGYATVGMVGYEGRYDYTASGTAVNLAARLCDEASDGEILLSPRAFTALEDEIEAESAGELELKGIRHPVEAFRVTGLKKG